MRVSVSMAVSSITAQAVIGITIEVRPIPLQYC